MSFFQRRARQAPVATAASKAAKGGFGARPQSLDWEFGGDDFDQILTPARGRATASPGARPQRTVITVTPTYDEPAQPVRAVPRGEQPTGTTSYLAQAFRGSNGPAQVAAVERSLERALEAWWGQGELPATHLLRDGLLVLEAGHELGESQRSLLLRTALARGKGRLTALRHQTDSERTAALLKEALLDLANPLMPADLRQLQQQDEKSAEWEAWLRLELTNDLPTLLGRQRQLAWAGLNELDGRPSPAVHKAALSPTSPFYPPFERTATIFGSRFRGVLCAVLVVLLLVVYLWRHGWTSSRTVITVPAGDYTVPTAGTAARLLKITAFIIDQTEVTNRDYRRCQQEGYCAAPSSLDSTTRHNYFTDGQFDNFPVIYVTWQQAHDFCRWAGKRLPTAAEWEVAASFAPATQRYYRFPWGDQFEPRLVNSLPVFVSPDADKTAAVDAGMALQDTQPVGFYHPYGDSPLGVADMAGNVAEWTATIATGNDQHTGGESYVVKGGSFQDRPDALLNVARQTIPGATAASWLGFRCAAATR